MKSRIPALLALFGSLLLMPAVNAEGEMRSPLGMDEEYQMRLMHEVESPQEAAARPKFPGRDQTAERNHTVENADDEGSEWRNPRFRVKPPYMEQCYETETNAWQDKVYYDAQERAPKIPGILRAPEQKLYSPDHKVYGTATCYKGNTAQWLKGTSAPLGKSLPETQNGLNAISGGYTGAAGAFDMSGGFKGGGASRAYPNLPPTATSVQVELNVAQ